MATGVPPPGVAGPHVWVALSGGIFKKSAFVTADACVRDETHGLGALASPTVGASVIRRTAPEEGSPEHQRSHGAIF